MKKRFFLAIVLSLLFCSAYSLGIMSGEKKIRVVKTKWFDIIYPEGSEKSARLLYEKADSIYYEIAELYGMEPQARMPVVLSPAVESQNAFWSSAYYNHIVIYDTTEIEALSVFSDTLLGTFRHELTHAYSYNVKNKFWRTLGNIFGEPLNPGMLFITPGWAEGAAVTSESSGGEGRINYEYFWQYMKQAKIDGNFPDYSDIQGAASKYPSGAYYNFNAAFNNWLQTKFGMDKYAAVWYKCVNFQTVSIGKTFKSVYGISINQAWKQFIDELPVPDVEKDPVKAGLTQDFFDASKKSFSGKNTSAHVYASLSVSEKGLIYTDSSASAVYFVEAEKLSEQTINPKKLFTQKNLKSAKFSADGRYIAVSYYSELSGAIKSRIKIYDFEKKRWINISGHGLEDASIVIQDGEYYLLALKFHSQEKSIYIRKFSDGSEKIVPMEKGVHPGNFVQAEKGFAFIKHQNLEYSICFADMNGEILKEIAAPQDKMIIQNLASGNSGISFSWTVPGSMPRAGLFSEESELFTLFEYDLSGGIYYPVFGNNKIFYAGVYYRQNRLFKMNMEQMKNAHIVLGEKKLLDNDKKENSPIEEVGEDLQPLPSKPYNALAYYTKGVLLPGSIVSSHSFSQNSKSSYELPFGLTYMTSNPWSKGILVASAGYGYETNSAGVKVQFSNGTDTSLFNYSIDAGTEFDWRGWKQANGELTMSSGIPFGRISFVSLSDKATVRIGRSNLDSDYVNDNRTFLPGEAADKNTRNDIYLGNAVRLSYSNIHRVGFGFNENFGFNIYSEFDSVYNGSLNFASRYSGYYDLELGTGFSFPKLIPAENTVNVTWTLPTTVQIRLFSEGSSSYTVGTNINFVRKSIIRPNLAGIYTNMLLLGVDIQKGLGLIFVRDLKIEAAYSCGYSYLYTKLNENMRILKSWEYFNQIKNGKLPFCQVIGLKTSMTFGLNFGTFANNSVGCSLGSEFSLGILENQFVPVLSAGITFSLP